jgi:ribonuclease G
MTRQNVTDGPREILTRKCPVCEGDGIVVSDASVAIDVERRLRALAAASRHQAFKVAVNEHVASLLIGPGAQRLTEIEAQSKRRFVLEARDDVPHDHFEVLGQGTLAKLQGETPVAEGAELQLKLVEVGRHDLGAGMGTLDGYTVCVGGAAGMIGKNVKVRVERFVDGTAYATLVSKKAEAEAPITAEDQAEKPTRKPPARKSGAPAGRAASRKAERMEPEVAAEPEEAPAAEEAVAAEPESEPKPKKKTRRGSRGGRGRKKKTVQPATVAEAPPEGDGASAEVSAPKIHVPDPGLGQDDTTEARDEAGGDGAAPKKKRTRRGTRGGRNRRKKTTASAGANGDSQQPAESDGAVDDYVPMSEWIDEVEAPRSG